jgi:hypothetical protein
MGYIKKVVDTGVEFADQYKVPEYVAKARDSSKLIDDASLKIATLYCEKGSPLLQQIDELTAAKINTALDIANSKVEQAQKLKTVAAGKVIEKKTEAIKMAELTKASLATKKDLGIAKYTAFKIEASKKVDETKSIMRKRINHASEEAVHFGQSVETMLKEKASKNEYTNKVLSVVLTAKEQVMMYGEALVKKSLSLPLTLQERMDKGLSYAKEEVEMKKMQFQELQKKYYGIFYVKTSVIRAEVSSFAEKSKVALNEKFVTVFGEDAKTKAEDMLKNLKAANGDVAAKMKSMYAASIIKVKGFAKTAEKMEEQYLGTTLVSKAQARFTGK